MQPTVPVSESWKMLLIRRCCCVMSIVPFTYAALEYGMFSVSVNKYHAHTGCFKENTCFYKHPVLKIRVLFDYSTEMQFFFKRNSLTFILHARFFLWPLLHKFYMNDFSVWKLDFYCNFPGKMDDVLDSFCHFRQRGNFCRHFCGILVSPKSFSKFIFFQLSLGISIFLSKISSRACSRSDKAPIEPASLNIAKVMISKVTMTRIRQAKTEFSLKLNFLDFLEFEPSISLWATWADKSCLCFITAEFSFFSVVFELLEVDLSLIRLLRPPFDFLTGKFSPGTNTWNVRKADLKSVHDRENYVNNLTTLK